MNIWIEIKQLKGQTLRTLDQRKPFDIVEVKEHQIVVRPHARNMERNISRDEVEAAFQHLAATGALDRCEIMEKYSLFNPAYVAAILAALPGVHHDIRPIRLWMEKMDAGKLGSSV